MATANDRAILNSIINPLQPTEEFTDDFCTEVDEASVTITCELEGTNRVSLKLIKGCIECFNI